MTDRTNVILAVFGRKGSGKTYLVFDILEEYDRIFVIDTVGQYDESRGFEVYHGRQACVAAIVAAHRLPRFKVALRVADTEEVFDLLHVIYEVPECMVVIEEAHFYCSSSFLHVELSKMARLGRHRNISQIYVAQRPYGINRNISSQADVVVSFQQHDDRDVQYLVQLGGKDALAVRDLPGPGDQSPPPLVAFGDMSKAPVAVIERQWKGGHKRQLDMFREK